MSGHYRSITRASAVFLTLLTLRKRLPQGTYLKLWQKPDSRIWDDNADLGEAPKVAVCTAASYGSNALPAVMLATAGPSHAGMGVRCLQGSSTRTNAKVEASAKDGCRYSNSCDTSNVAACGLLRVSFLGYLHAVIAR